MVGVFVSSELSLSGFSRSSFEEVFIILAGGPSAE